MKKITFEEGKKLALYAEFYGRCYAKWDVMRMIGLIPTSMKDRELSASIEELGQKKLKKIEYILADGY